MITSTEINARRQQQESHIPSLYKRLTLLLIIALQLALVALPTIAKSELTMNALETEIIDQVYIDTKVDRMHCVFTVHRNSFAESAIEGIELDSVGVRLLLTTPPKGLYPIVAYLHQSDGTEIHGQVTLYAQRFDSVLVIGSSARRGQPGIVSKPKSEFSDITKIIETPLKSRSELDNKQFRRVARVGAIMTAEMLEDIPDILPGDEVVIKYQRGGLLLQMRGRSLGKGIVGETIRVKNLSSQKIITGTISGVGIVSLMAPGAGSR